MIILSRYVLCVVFIPGSRESDDPWENNRISVEFVAFVYEDESVVGKTVSLGATLEIDASEIWAGKKDVQLAARTPMNYVRLTCSDIPILV